MTDLKRLIERVTDGTATMQDFASVFPSETAYGKTTWGTAHNAFDGSLDAAKALHEAIAPFPDVDIEYRLFEGLCDVTIYDVEGGPAKGTSTHGIARAWLLAILRAVEAGR